MRLLITGGTGTVGRAIIRARLEGRRFPNVTSLTVLTRDEEKGRRLQARWDSVGVVIGDVCDPVAVADACARADCVIHAAALKFIPDAERHPQEALRVNVEGSRNVIRACELRGLPMVAISTDKAVEPVNVYGASKMLMERLIAERVRLGLLRGTAVRYGNVIGSTGSVAQLFWSQIAAGEPITITDPAMTRFWLPVDRAVRFLETAVDAVAGNGDADPLMIPWCDSLTMQAVAEIVIETAHGSTAATRVVGRRPAEKLHETLMTEAEAGRSRSVEWGWWIADPLRRPWRHAEAFTSAGADDAAASPMFRDALTELIELGEL